MINGFILKPQFNLVHRTYLIKVSLFYIGLFILWPVVGNASYTAQNTVADQAELNLTSKEKDWLSEHQIIRVVLDPDWAPVEYRDKKGNYQGMSVDYLNKLEKLLNIRFEIVEGLSWQEAVAAVKSKQADMFASVSKTPQRGKYSLFTKPYVSMPINIFTRDEISYIGKLENLIGKRVAVVDGYAIHDWIKSEHPELTLVPVKSPPEGLRLVSKGNLEFFVGNVMTSNYYLRKLDLDNLHVAGETPYANNQSMAVRDDWPVFIAILQKALNTIPQLEHDRIFSRWSSIQFEKEVDLTLLWQLIILVFIVLALFLYWNRSLSIKVKKHTALLKDELALREASESKLREREVQLLQAQEISQMGSWQVDLTSSIGVWSEEAKQLLGLKLKNNSGVFPETLLKILHPDDRASLQRSFERIGKSSDIYEVEYRVNHPFRGERHIHCKAKVFRDDNDKPLSLAGVAQDITEQKRTEIIIQNITTSVAASTGEMFFNELVANLCKALNMNYAHIGELTSEKQHIKTLAVWHNNSIAPNYEYELAGSPCENVTNTGICTYNSGICQLFPEDKQLQEMGFESYVGVPLVNSDKESVGIMVVLDSRPLPEPEFTETLLSIFAVRATTELERLRYEGKLRLASSMFENTTEGIIIADTNSKVVTVNQAFTEITGYREEDVIGKSPRVWKSQHHDESFYQAMWESIKQSGNWQGEIWNRRKNGDAYPAWMTINAIRDQQGKLTNYVSVFSDISTIKESEERLQFLAHHDPLTKLPNRLLFSARLEHVLQQAHRDRGLVAVMFLDLDNFKQINDGLGHPVGDKVLQEVARRLSEQIREEDTVARLGGDEFAIVLGDLPDAQEASHVANKLLTVFEAPLEIDSHRLYVTPTLGISLYPNDGDNVATLLKNADTAMYRAKERGKNQFCYYTLDFTHEALEKLQLENDLREALKNDEFELYYQPQYELSTGHLTGAEALIRWHHKELGMVSPDKFIPLAENTGLIIPIGNWVMKEACVQMKAWKDAGFDIERIGINVAGQQIQSNDIVKTVSDVLNETRLDPQCLELEITESFIMQQADKAIITLEELQKLGVALAIDDFGTGYSSLSYLKRLPIDRLKIDRSFIKDIPHDTEGKAIAKAIIALGKSMQLNVIAEGVETVEQKEFIAEEGCDEAQGYLYSRPVNAQEISEILRKNGL